MKFTCARCGHNRIEEVLTEVTAYYEIEGFDEEGDPVYGEQYELDGGDVFQYRCAGCKTVIATDLDELRELLGIQHNETA